MCETCRINKGKAKKLSSSIIKTHQASIIINQEIFVWRGEITFRRRYTNEYNIMKHKNYLSLLTVKCYAKGIDTLHLILQKLIMASFYSVCGAERRVACMLTKYAHQACSVKMVQCPEELAKKNLKWVTEGMNRREIPMTIKSKHGRVKPISGHEI